jgi:hypothetical protein
VRASKLERLQAKARKRNQPTEPSQPAVAEPLAVEQHYSTAQIAKLWAMSARTIRRLFGDRPGVIKLGGGKKTLSIPQTVLTLVHQELTA